MTPKQHLMISKQQVVTPKQQLVRSHFWAHIHDGTLIARTVVNLASWCIANLTMCFGMEETQRAATLDEAQRAATWKRLRGLPLGRDSEGCHYDNFACHLEETQRVSGFSKVYLAETQLDAIHGCSSLEGTGQKGACSAKRVSRLGTEQGHGVRKVHQKGQECKDLAMGKVCVHDASAIFARAEALALAANAGTRRR